MDSFKVYSLIFTVRAKEPIRMGKHNGTIIRGALLDAMYKGFCYTQVSNCNGCSLHRICYPYQLAGRINLQSRWGMNPVRPYTLEPPLTPQVIYSPQESFSFAINLFMDTSRLLPAIIAGLRVLGQRGIGHKDSRTHRRGTFSLDKVFSLNKLTGQRHLLQQDETWVSSSIIPITHPQVIEAAQAVPDQLSLHFKTPTRIVDKSRVLRTLQFRPFFQRLIERLAFLHREYCHSELEINFRELIDQSNGIEIVDENTRWIDHFDFSTRTKQYSPLGGLVGKATIAGDLKPLLPWLIWGQFTHVGKSTTKGNGWYELEIDGCTYH